jgi:hypothetical protein
MAHIADLRPAPRPLPQSPAAVSEHVCDYDLRMRQLGRLRRTRETDARDYVSRWYTDAFVAVVTTTSRGAIMSITAMYAPPYDRELPPMWPRVTIRIPVEATSACWRPRVAPLLWDGAMPYAALLRDALDGLRTHSSCAVDNAFYDYATAVERRRGQSRAAQSIERALAAVYHGLARRERGELAVPRADTASGAVRTLYERTQEEQRQLRSTLRAIRLRTGTFPGFNTQRAEDAIVDRYTIARLATPHRASQADHAPMRVACFVAVLMPHVAPLAPDASVASAVARAAHKSLTAAYPEHYARMRQLAGVSPRE